MLSPLYMHLNMVIFQKQRLLSHLLDFSSREQQSKDFIEN